MATLKAGDVVVADFPGITGVKRRPAVVISTDSYHNHRPRLRRDVPPDVILGAITTNLSAATTPTDHILTDWASEGLRHLSAFRAFLVTLPQKDILAVIGHLSNTDWTAVRNCLRRAISV